MKKFTEQVVKQVEDERQKMPDHLVKVDLKSYYEGDPAKDGITEIWVSNSFRLAVFVHADGTEQLNIHRTHIDHENDAWKDGITWDEMMELKRQCGRGERDFFEWFPRDSNIVNNGNFRHLWLANEDGKIPAFLFEKKTSLSVKKQS